MNISAHQLIKVTKEQRVFFCGDVHGNFRQLLQQLKDIGFDHDSDILILTGDIIDRGNENLEMIEYVTQTPRVYSVLGNHESMFLAAIHDELVRSIYTSTSLGGNWIENHTQAELEEMGILIASCMPIAITVQREDFQIGVIHAASPPNWQDVLSPTDKDTEYHLWSREQFVNAKNNLKADHIRGIDIVIHGHVCSEITICGNQAWIDTSWPTGKLTILESRQLLHLVQKQPNQKIRK